MAKTRRRKKTSSFVMFFEHVLDHFLRTPYQKMVWNKTLGHSANSKGGKVFKGLIKAFTRP